MPSNEGHIHWTGSKAETVTYLNQVVEMDTDSNASDPIGSLVIFAQGFQGTPLMLPNSSSSAPRWDTVPGSSPALEVRQDGHFPTGYIRIRLA